jgi:hypothetical protein
MNLTAMSGREQRGDLMAEKSCLTPRVRAVLAVGAGLLAVQCAFIHFFGEPYPALTMPTFSGSSGYRDGAVEMTQYDAVFISAGQEFSFTPNELLADFPDGHRAAIAANALRPTSDAAPTPTKASRIRRIQETIFPGFAAGNLSRNSAENKASLRAWLRERAESLVPGRPVSRAEIRWYRVAETFGADGTRVESRRTPGGTLIVPLAGGPR